MRLIDADELKKVIEQDEGFSWDSLGKDDLCIRRKYIDNAPTVDVTALCPVDFPTADDPYPCCSYKRPRGEWEEPFEMGDKSYHKCSNCHISTQLILISNFCPNCGAKMGGST